VTKLGRWATTGVCIFAGRGQGSKDLRWIGTNEPVDVCP